MDYVLLKTVHQTAVLLSVSGFFARGWGSLQGAAWPTTRLAKTLPHAIDSLLLASALLLAWTLRLTPGNAPWLLAKLIGLLLYIALGVVALRPGRPVRVRAVAWSLALLTVGWIASVAITKQPLGLVSLLVHRS
jgi:uncharacterized membrane protein SirB2